MTEYDQWKTALPPEPQEYTCDYCGEECDGHFCSNACQVAYFLE